MRIVKQQRRDGIVSDDLGLDETVAHHGVSKAVQVVGDKSRHRPTAGPRALTSMFIQVSFLEIE